MTFPLITATLTALILLLQMVLMLSAGLHRGKTGVGVGTGDDQNLERKVRRHGNLAENAALFLLALALAEMFGASAMVIKGFAILFLIARLAHALAFSSLAGSHGADGNKIFGLARIIGALGTALSGVGIAGYLLYLLCWA
jgi:uncharacterized membrane protein YecN with MAPEG domain